jgi:glycosyltransferase involved in cell wall biosynthesis
MENNYCSIVMVTYRVEDRKDISRKSLNSLLDNTTYPYELILIDQTQNNRTLGKARNIGISMATGKYIVITDDDIEFKPGWLEECIKMIEMNGKLLSTPVIQKHVLRWEMESYMGYRRNYRTGSNCMVMKKSDLDILGNFCESDHFSKVGRRYANNIVRKGYSFLVPQKPLANDLSCNKHSYKV